MEVPNGNVDSHISLGHVGSLICAVAGAQVREVGGRESGDSLLNPGGDMTVEHHCNAVVLFKICNPDGKLTLVEAEGSHLPSGLAPFDLFCRVSLSFFLCKMEITVPSLATSQGCCEEKVGEKCHFVNCCVNVTHDCFMYKVLFCWYLIENSASPPFSPNNNLLCQKCIWGNHRSAASWLSPSGLCDWKDGELLC